MEPTIADSFCPLPEDVVLALVPFLSNLDNQFRLALTTKRLLRRVPFQITSYREVWRRSASNPRSYIAILPTLKNVTSLTVHFQSKDKWTLYHDLLILMAPTLKKLNLGSSSTVVGAEIPKSLLTPSAHFPPFAKLEKLSMAILSVCPKDLSFHLFPKLQNLSIISTTVQKYIEAIVRDCPGLKSLSLQHGPMSHKHLEQLKGLSKLLKLRAYVRDDAFSLAWSELSNGKFASKEDLLACVDRFVDLVNQTTHIGLAWQDPSSQLISIAAKNQQELPILLQVLQHHRRAGVALDSQGLLATEENAKRILSCIKDVNTLRSLIENQLIDLGAQLTYSYEPSRLLYEILNTNSSIEMFQLIFETDFDAAQGKTPFEYAKSLHPEYPFFWQTPIFTIAARVDLMRYIMVHRDRLLALFGTELALGGPNVASIEGVLPIHVAVKRDVFAFLVEQGIDPWVPDMFGDNILCIHALPRETVEFLLSHPSYNPQFVNRDGLSHLDLVLKRRLSVSDVIDNLLESDVIITPHTPDLMVTYVEHAFPAVHFKPLVRLLNRLESRQISHVFKSWIDLQLTDDFSGRVCKHLIRKFSHRVDIPAFELALLQEPGGPSLLTFCAWARSSTAFRMLLLLVFNSELGDQIFDKWRVYLPAVCQKMKLPSQIQPKPVTMASFAEVPQIMSPHQMNREQLFFWSVLRSYREGAASTESDSDKSEDLIFERESLDSEKYDHVSDEDSSD